jgi:SAM-dependent methyltransferase
VTFTPDVYEQIREGAMRSARVIVPLVYELFEPRTVVDVGCGEGWFAREFANCGCTVKAYDESVTGDRVEWTDSFDGPPGRGGNVTFRHADLLGDVRGDVWGDYSDLAVCLEVAEHLPAIAADPFIATLCALAPVVLFSAAIPGQGGHGHLNEQPPAYWVERFERHGFEVSGELRWHFWGAADVEPWYQQNLLVAVNRDRVMNDIARNHGYDELFGPSAFSDPIHVVHPTTFEYWVEIAKARR